MNDRHKRRVSQVKPNPQAETQFVFSLRLSLASETKLNDLDIAAEVVLPWGLSRSMSVEFVSIFPPDGPLLYALMPGNSPFSSPRFDLLPANNGDGD